MSAPEPNLILIGMMGSGKTTVGRHVARRLGRAFVDTDHVVEIELGMSIPEIFASRGEDGFRDLEAAVIQRVAAVPNQIVAVGGGAILRERNLAALRAGGRIVLLDAPVTQLAGRIGRGRSRADRPLLAGDAGGLARIQALWRERAPLYEAAADHRVDAGHRPPVVIADELVAWWRDSLASGAR